MNLVEAAERFAASDRSRVELDPGRCLLTRDAFSECRQCADICPVGAIQWGHPPEIDGQVCVNCLGCLGTCPMGAISARDSFPALLRCVSRLDVTSLDLICEKNSSPALGPSDSQGGVVVQGCLAGLGRPAYLALAALGMRKVAVRLEECRACPLGTLREEVHLQVEQVRAFIDGDGGVDRISICLVEESEEAQHDRPYWESANPPISRRDFFLLAGRQGQLAAARAMVDLEPVLARGPSLLRRRELAAFAKLSERGTVPLDIPLLGMGYALVRVSSDCSACGACARACPSGALAFDADDETYRLAFEASACNGCEACVHVCAEEAVTVHHEPTYGEVFGHTEPAVLSEGSMSRCAGCEAWMADAEGKTFCSLCSYRMSNPFGSRLPPQVASKVQARMSGQRQPDVSAAESKP